MRYGFLFILLVVNNQAYTQCDVYAGNDTSFCNQSIPGQILGYSPELNEGGFGVFYGIGGATGAVSVTGEVNPIQLGIGTFEVVYEFTNISGCTNTDTLIITVSDPIVADAGSDTTVCYNAPHLQLEGFSPDIGVLWSGTNAISSNAILDSLTGLINPQLLLPGVYTYQLESGEGTCLSQDLVSLTVNPLPILSLGGNDVFCVNDEVMPLTTFNPVGGTWEGDGVVDPTAGTFDTSIGVGDWDLFYWYTDPGTTCSDTIGHLVTVQEIPVVYAGNDISICNQTNPTQITGFSPGLTENGAGFLRTR